MQGPSPARASAARRPWGRGWFRAYGARLRAFGAQLRANRACLRAYWGSALSQSNLTPSLSSPASNYLEKVRASMKLSSEPGSELLRLVSEVCRKCCSSYFMVYALVINVSDIIPQSHAPDFQEINNPYLSIICT